MTSIAFPRMFTDSSTLLYEDKKATMSNLMLLLKSEKNSLFGDPYFGTRLKRVLFEQNTTILADLVIDELYTAIALYFPQLGCNRNDIKLVSKGTDIVAEIKCINLLNYTIDLYEINLTSE